MTTARRVNATNVRKSYSPFTHINAIHKLHIQRYIENGWLPTDYDPHKTETWPL